MPVEASLVRTLLDRPFWRALVLPRPGVVVAALLLVCAAKGAFHANPYVPWAERDAMRLRYLAALSDRSGALCELHAEAGDAAALFVLPNDRAVDPATVTLAYRSAFNTIYQVAAERSCAERGRISGKGGEDFLQRLELVPGGG